MTISSSVRTAGPYVGTGLVAAYPFAFKVFQAADLYVVRQDTGGVQTTLSLSVDYTVTLNVDQNVSPGGTITLAGALPVGYTLTATTNIALLQPLSLPNQGGFFPRNLEDEFDRLTIILQQLNAIGGVQALRVPEIGGVPPLATVAARANNLLGFDSLGNPIAVAPVSGSAAALATDLANSANAAKGAGQIGFAYGLGYAVGTIGRWLQDLATSVGSGFIGHIHTGVGAVATLVRSKLRTFVDPVLDFGVPNTGLADATPALQAMITELATRGVAEVRFPPGTYLLRAPASETGEPRSYAAAVVWKQLKNLRISGSKGTKFIQDAAGAGAPEFAMFRFEECENIEMCHFAADGSGINIYGVGAARSSFAFIANHNLDTKVDLTIPNRNLHFHHLVLDNFGGGICSATRTEAGFAYPLVTKGISIHDIEATNIAGQNHFAGITYSENVHVYNNNVKNPLVLVAQIGNCFADMSAGVVNALVENNYAIGFTGGAKAETHTGAGVASNEDRVSQNVTFRNNTFEQIGDPITMIFPGGGGGGFYGIKLNGINHSAYNNTITARTVNISTGGLYQGIQLTSTAISPVETVHTAFGNDIKGPVIGINHDSPSDALRRYMALIIGNKIRDTYTPAAPVAGNDGTGIIVSRNAIVRDNRIYRTRYCAISINTPDQTLVRDNVAVNCAVVNHVTAAARITFSQEGSGAQGFFEFTNNTILDDRGASAADYGYFFQGGTTYTNKYLFAAGLTEAVKTGVSFDKYFSYLGTSLAVDGVLTIGSRTIYTTNTPSAIGPWNGMAWRVGDRAVNKTPAVGVAKAWSCTVAGTPGTWVSEGNL